MSAAEHWQVQGREAELYERHLVPAVTALWAADLVERDRCAARRSRARRRLWHRRRHSRGA